MGAGATQRRAPDQEQHFRSPEQSVSKLHGELDNSGSAVGQTPGLDANSPDRFRAGGMIQIDYISIESRISW